VGEGKGVKVGGGPWVFVGTVVGREIGTGRGKDWQAAIRKVKPSQASFFVKII
jgi:hypothetical protein